MTIANQTITKILATYKRSDLFWAIASCLENGVMTNDTWLSVISLPDKPMLLSARVHLLEMLSIWTEYLSTSDC